MGRGAEPDVFAAFEKSGDLYNRDLADKLRKLYESGDNEDPAILFKNVMGRDPDAAALFIRRVTASRAATTAPRRQP